MVKMTKSLSIFLSRNYPKEYITIGFGHVVDWNTEYDSVFERELLLGGPVVDCLEKAVEDDKENNK